MSGLRIDHVIIGARDIEQVRSVLWDSYGFGVIQGSTHPDGTQGWLVPFDTPDVQYLELLTPGDGELLAGSTFGRVFLDRTAAGPVFLNWAVLSAQVERDAARVRALTGDDPGLLRGESVRADGQRFPWAEAAFESSWRYPCRPFFLEYGNWTARTARVAGDILRAGHRRIPIGFGGVTVSSTRPDLASWWGDGTLPVRVEAGHEDAVTAVRVRTADGDVELVLS